MRRLIESKIALWNPLTLSDLSQNGDRAMMGTSQVWGERFRAKIPTQGRPAKTGTKYKYKSPVCRPSTRPGAPRGPKRYYEESDSDFQWLLM